MAEGVGISVLVRAYAWPGVTVVEQAKRATYAKAATLALAVFQRPTSARGVTASDNGTWYEEYLPPSHLHVLNGMIFAMMGLREYGQVFHDTVSVGLWNAGVATLVTNLYRFDTGSWSYYDCAGLVASIHYHELHIFLLNTMYQITGIKTFDNYRARFQTYLNKR
jgi:hypothetical protein